MTGADPRWGCHRKRAYSDQKDAVRALDRMRREGKDDGRLGVYGCTSCGQYHVGHNSRREA